MDAECNQPMHRRNHKLEITSRSGSVLSLGVGCLLLTINMVGCLEEDPEDGYFVISYSAALYDVKPQKNSTSYIIIPYPIIYADPINSTGVESIDHKNVINSSIIKATHGWALNVSFKGPFSLGYYNERFNYKENYPYEYPSIPKLGGDMWIFLYADNETLYENKTPRLTIGFGEDDHNPDSLGSSWCEYSFSIKLTNDWQMINFDYSRCVVS